MKNNLNSEKVTVQPKIFSHAERFFMPIINGVYAAPLTLGAPGNLLNIDYSVFKKTSEEKAEVKRHKRNLPKTKNYQFKTTLHAAF